MSKNEQRLKNLKFGSLYPGFTVSYIQNLIPLNRQITKNNKYLKITFKLNYILGY